MTRSFSTLAATSASGWQRAITRRTQEAHRVAGLVAETGGADIDDASLAVDSPSSPITSLTAPQSICQEDGLEEAAISVAEISDRVQRDIGQVLPKTVMEGEQFVHRRARG